MKRVRINYKTVGYVEVDYADDLIQFLDTVPRDSCDKADVRIMEYYYNLNWPSVAAHNCNVPDTYLGYNVVNYNGKR